MEISHRPPKLPIYNNFKRVGPGFFEVLSHLHVSDVLSRGALMSNTRIHGRNCRGHDGNLTVYHQDHGAALFFVTPRRKLSSTRAGNQGLVPTCVVENAADTPFQVNSRLPKVKNHLQSTKNRLAMRLEACEAAQSGCQVRHRQHAPRQAGAVRTEAIRDEGRGAPDATCALARRREAGGRPRWCSTGRPPGCCP